MSMGKKKHVSFMIEMQMAYSDPALPPTCKSLMITGSRSSVERLS